MKTLTHLAVYSLLLSGIPVHGEESVIEQSRQLSQKSLNEYDASPTGEEMRYPAIVITDSFDSHLASKKWNFTADVLILHTEYGSVDFSDADGGGEAAGGFRLAFGWEGNSGFGIRTRYGGVSNTGSTEGYMVHGYDSDTGPVITGYDYYGVSPTAETATDTELIAASWDIDIYKRFTRERTDLLLGAGLRGSSFLTRAYPLIDSVPVEFKEEVHGAGITLFSDLRHVLRHNKRSELAMVGSGRVSFLSGEWEHSVNSLGFGIDADMTISEGSLGLEWARDLGRSVLVIQGQYEVQLWNSDVTSDLAFNGAAIRVGFSW